MYNALCEMSQIEICNRVWFKDIWLERIKADDQLVLKIRRKKSQAILMPTHISLQSGRQCKEIFSFAMVTNTSTLRTMWILKG